tara:strand:- start:251 stop:418 length:168 start_codon:yes stop_codon:yes gene_type:complete
MTKGRIQMWPPAGGEPVEIFEADKDSFILKGWTELKPQPKTKAVKAAETDKAKGD